MARQGGTENKAGAPADGTQQQQAPAESKGRAEEYEQKATRGGHGVVGAFPHPFGSRLPDLGDVPEVKEEGAQG